jgi:hypothetical protein
MPPGNTILINLETNKAALPSNQALIDFNRNPFHLAPANCTTRPVSQPPRLISSSLPKHFESAMQPQQLHMANQQFGNENIKIVRADYFGERGGELQNHRSNVVRINNKVVSPQK